MTAKSDISALDTMTFPLHGARLIEASAGTGKTFTIAGLYLRLLLGHGSEQTRHRAPLTVDQILVVTFTEAATAELRDRIRGRIHAARLAFARGQSNDPVIAPLLDQVDNHAQAAQILLDAERQMDEAAIFTIHGFCQRMLTQNAFESGSRFSHEFVTDETRLKAQVVADYWRRNFYPLPLNLAGEVRKLWASPADLLAQISGYLTGAPLALSVAPMAQDLAQLHSDNLQQIDRLKSLWRQHQQQFSELFEQSGINRRSYSKTSLPKWLASVDEWAGRPSQDYSYPDALEKFAQNVLNEKTSSGTPPSHPVFSEIESFLSQPVSLKAPLIAHAIQQCRQRLAEAKQQHQWLSFDDLLTQLSAALDQDQQALLSERIRSLYPVAMIDEFQDTDPLQYSIFSRLYLDHPECGLFMIGDPKQAIYAFRGADIFTYIKARKQVSSHFTLGTNWRSSADMVAAVNRIFAGADKPFIYDEDIPFLPVQPSPAADQRYWSIEGQSQPALSYWLFQDDEQEKPVSKGDYQNQLAVACASQINRILTLADTDQAQLHSSSGARPIRASDIAVLVRTGSEAQLVRQALAEQGVASVYLSNRDSVMTSQVASDLLLFLQAALTPEQEAALKSCLASELFAQNASQLEQLNHDEVLWEQVVKEFRQYREVWKRVGVMPMLRSMISQRHIAERLLEEPGGERALTDLMHLSELLQQASLTLDSDHGLLRWLAQALDDAEHGLAGSDDYIQRLESERNLVQIVTIHKSKGLEYNLVFLPFVMSYRQAGEAKYYDDIHDQTMLDLNASAPAMLAAERERLAEDLRLIYVALTRAVYGCFIGVTPIRNGRSAKAPTGVHHSAMGYLLQNGQPGDIAALSAAIEAQIGPVAGMTCTELPEPPTQSYQPQSEPEQPLAARQMAKPVDRLWRLTSYSALVKQGGQQSHDASLEPIGYDIDSADEQTQPELLASERSIFNFPRGARPGTFLHTIFEQVEFGQPAASDHNRAVISQLLEQEQFDAEWQPVLEQLVDTVLATPLDGRQMKLNQTQPEQRLVEMEFLLPIEVLSSSELNQLAQRHDPLSARAQQLGFQTVQGMLKGFIDLVFEYKGKYYVLDWKSNHLGDTVSDYHGQALQSAMVDHRYDLQYQIYALALHRMLKSRLADYDYQRHFGGVYYLFLRGIDGDSEHGIFSAKPSQPFLEQLDRLIAGQSPEPGDEPHGQMELGL